MNLIKKNKKGFTLIELIVVIAILGILVLLAVPRFLGYTKNANVSTMQADAKVLSNASLVYNIEKEGTWPVAEGEAETIKIDDKTVSVKAIDESKLKDQIQTLKNDIEGYKFVDADQADLDLKKGDIVYEAGVEDREGNMHYGVNLEITKAGE